jgi:hypothetical protein
MKRGCPDHPKTLALASALRIPIYSAVGLLEMLWHWTSRYAQAGDIGRHPDAAICAGVGWHGGTSRLIMALVECGWLDADPTHRLLVHDWQDHADQTVRRYLSLHGLKMLVASQHDASMRSVKTSLPSPSPSPIAIAIADSPSPVAVQPVPAGKPPLLISPSDYPSLDTPEFRTAWAEWLRFNAERKKKMPDTTKQAQLRTLAKIGPVEAIGRIQQSIEFNYQGLFPVKERHQAPPGPPANNSSQLDIANGLALERQQQEREAFDAARRKQA